MQDTPPTTVIPRLIDVYPYRMASGGVEFLLLRRSKNRIYAGQWRMIGGKIQAGETAAEAAVREFREETGLGATLFWCVPSVNSFFDFERNMLHHIPVFACCCEAGAEPVLNHEHDKSGWFSTQEAIQLTPWPEQQRLITLIERILQTGAPLPEEWILHRLLPVDSSSQTEKASNA